MTESNCTCWFCGGALIWDSDFTAEDVFGEGAGNRLVAFLHCSECGAIVQYTEAEE